MSEEKREKVKKLREYLKSLTPDERKAIADKIGLHNIEGHVFSDRNQCLIAFQSGAQQIQGTLGGFKQWVDAGRVVKKGEHGFIIWFPVNRKTINDNGEEVDETQFYLATVFDISQTEPLEKGESL